MSECKSVIVARDVSFSYPKGPPLFERLNLTLYQGEFTAIVGENGSGKTTLGKLLCGILRPAGGSVSILGEESHNLSLGSIGQKIGYLFQNPDQQLFALTVREELCWPLQLRGEDAESVRRKVGQVLGRFQLAGLEDKLPFRLSRGEKQRLVLAAIMLQRPSYLILDEPTSSLDQERRAGLSQVLQELQAEGIGMAVITHDSDFLQQHAQRVIQLREGRVVADERVSP
ncbi:MAG: energy-coupling factor ABC transporter ATP-binding protein [Bacillota bacterium]